MVKIVSHLLKAYDKNEPELYLKAKFILITTVVAIFGITLTLAYTSYTFGIYSTTVLVESIGFSIMVLALITLVRGRYFLAGHIILTAGFSVVWIVMFTEPLSSVLIKLDTIVFVLVLLIVIPLMFFKNKNPLFFYFLLNFSIFGVFIYYMFDTGTLTTRESVDYASDNTIAMLIILFVSYNLSKIYHQALSSLTSELAERKKAEFSLKELRSLLTSIIESMPSIVIGVDKNQTIVLLNEETTKMTGVFQDNASGKKLYDVLPQLYFLEFNINNAIQNNKISKMHKQPVLWDENQSFMDITIYPMLYGSEKGAVIRLDDISERIQMEEMVVQSEKMALVGEVAGNMAHDFNNVLSIIMGNVELSMMVCHDPRIKTKLELIYNQTIRGKNLTKNLIAFAKDQEPKQEFFSINEKIDLVINLMKKDLDGVELVREEKMGLPDLLADSGMIEHALVNLIQNAIHATSASKAPNIILRSYAKDDNICFEIEDNGCGLAEEHFDNIYSPTFTLKGSKDTTNSYDPSVKGTGYGMYNVRKYIQQHKGSIDLQSTVDIGTKFTITLPVIKRELTSEEKIKIGKEIEFVEKKILLVEDEAAIADIQCAMLTHSPCNHSVDIAENAQIAIDLFDKNQYDLVSLDYMLPGKKSGMDVYNHIRLTDKKIPILFISGNIEFLESIKNLKQQDNNIDHQSKPCKNADYVKCINQLLEMCSIEN